MTGSPKLDDFLPECLNHCRGKITGVIHIGAHDAEELPAYEAAGVSRVVWIEADPLLVCTLKHKLDTPGHSLIEAAVCDFDGETDFHRTSNEGSSSSIYPLAKHAIHYPTIVVTDKIRVPSRTLDSLDAEYDFAGCNWLSMDIQGAECAALRGGTKLLRKIEFVFTEFNLDELYAGCGLSEELESLLPGFRLEGVVTVKDADWGDAFFVRD